MGLGIIALSTGVMDREFLLISEFLSRFRRKIMIERVIEHCHLYPESIKYIEYCYDTSN